jgi:anaerobic glycerol-3-phosphate dehydrogenase
MFNPRADRYRQQAEECRNQANSSKHTDHQESWRKLATQWDRLAEGVAPRVGQQAQQPQPDKPKTSN